MPAHFISAARPVPGQNGSPVPMRDAQLINPMRSDRRPVALIFTPQGAPRVLAFGQDLRVFAWQYLRGGMVKMQAKTPPNRAEPTRPAR